MSQFNFEGDIGNISERQLELINEVIVKHEYENSKIFFERVGLPGDNYVASVKRITIEGSSGIIKLIAKIAPTLDTMRQAMNTYLLFRNEHIMYEEVLPKLVQLQKDAEVPEKEQLKFAKCYGSFTEEPNEVIILEDLTVSGFVMLDRFSPLSSDCVKSVLKNFAILHSLSYALRNKEPKTYDKFRKTLNNMWSLMFAMDHTQEHFKNLEADTLLLLEDEKYNTFMRDKISNTIHLSLEMDKDDIDSKFTVITQGDAWTNNIMFRFENNELTDSLMIDYQLSQDSSPGNDIMYMLFNCTDHNTRLQNFKDWIDYYYSELGSSLSEFNLNVNLVYPRDMLENDLKKCSQFMFGLCVAAASMMIRKTDDAAKVMDVIKSENLMEGAQQLSMFNLDEDSKTRYKNRVMGLIDTCLEFGLLK